MAFRVTAPLRLKALQKWAYGISGFNRYGLYRDDLLDSYCDPDVEEALRRLPAQLQDERNFRIISAVQLSLRKEVLPSNQWSQLEDDVLYLSPIVEQVKREREEREKWDDEH